MNWNWIIACGAHKLQFSFFADTHDRNEKKKLIRKNLLHRRNFSNFEYGRFFPGSIFVLVNVRFVGFYYIITHQHKQIIRNGANTQHTNTNAMNNNKIHEIKRMYLISNIIFCWIFFYSVARSFFVPKSFCRHLFLCMVKKYRKKLCQQISERKIAEI